MSEIAVTRKPAVFKALIPATLPAPAPFTNTDTSLSPASYAFLPASSAALVAAYGVGFLEPLKPTLPALLLKSALPSKSVRVIIVLLKPVTM